ncbi:O-antigen ligase family protein [Patescibacteria group bacterium]|nr:O-antigen ligase family protein [Patescibacteria group bacterium]
MKNLPRMLSTESKSFLSSKVMLFLLLFLLSVLVSILFSPDIRTGLFEYSILLLIIVLPLIAVKAIKRIHLQKSLISLFVISSAILSLWGIAEYYGIASFQTNPEFGSRVVTAFSNPNHYASFLSATFLPILIYFIWTKNKKVKYLFLVLLCLVFTNILYAGSRGVYISLFFATVVLMFVMFKYTYGLIKSNKYWLTSLLLLFLVIINVYSVPNPLRHHQSVSVADRIASSAEMMRPGTTRDFSIRERVYIWHITLSIIKQAPILGTGLGTYEKNFIRTRDILRTDQDFLNKYPPEVFKNIKNHAHNEFLHLWAESGIFSVLFFVLFAVSVLLLIRKIPLIPSEFDRMFFTAALCSVGMILMQGLVSYPLHILPVALIFWTYTAFFVIKPEEDG